MEKKELKEKQKKEEERQKEIEERRKERLKHKYKGKAYELTDNIKIVRKDSPTVDSDKKNQT